MVLEMDILISNLSPVLKEKVAEYKERLKPVLQTIDKRNLFIKDRKNNNQIVCIDLLPMLNTTISYISKIKSDLIMDISPILYLPEVSKKEW